MAPRAKARADFRLLRTLNRSIQRLAHRLEADNVAQFVTMTQRPWRMMWVNLMAGLARGVGIFLGAGVMGALALAIATWGVYYLLKVFDMIPVVSEMTKSVQDLIKDFLSQYRPSS